MENKDELWTTHKSKKDKKGSQSAATELDELFTDPGYEQLYIIFKAAPIDTEAKRHEGNEVMFLCGKWCYTGIAHFDDTKQLTVNEIPILIPSLQRQQSSLKYFCNSSAIPKSSCIGLPVILFCIILSALRSSKRTPFSAS